MSLITEGYGRGTTLITEGYGRGILRRIRREIIRLYSMISKVFEMQSRL
jgi:hypothetical protein